jgi:hypothetical protein
MIEAAIFADDDDDVLDGRGGLDLIDSFVWIVSGVGRRTKAENRYGEHECASGGLRAPFPCAAFMHILLLVEINGVGGLTGKHDSRIKMASQLRESFLRACGRQEVDERPSIAFCGGRLYVAGLYVDRRRVRNPRSELIRAVEAKFQVRHSN